MARRFLLAALACALLAACAGVPPTGEVTVPTDTSISKVRQGVAAKDASADVRLGKWQRNMVAGEFVTTSGIVEITNHSGKASNYYIEIRLVDEAGIQVDTPAAIVQVVEPGGKARTEWTSIQDPGKSGSASILTVERTAA